MILQRHQNWPTERRSKIERAWEGRTVVCIATGPSLTSEQVAQVRASEVPTIVINDAYLLAPFADLAYFADLKWWNWHKDRSEWKAFAGQKCSIYVGGNLGTSTAGDVNIHLLVRSEQEGISTDPGSICTGSNSGYQALNIAILAGAKRIVLLGYDGQSTGGRDHYFGEHPDKSKPPFEVMRQRFSEAVEPAKKLGVEILQATPGSVINCFPMVSLAEGLESTPRPALV